MRVAMLLLALPTRCKESLAMPTEMLDSKRCKLSLRLETLEMRVSTETQVESLNRDESVYAVEKWSDRECGRVKESGVLIWSRPNGGQLESSAVKIVKRAGLSNSSEFVTNGSE